MLRALETAHLVKRVSQKHEDLSANPRFQCKKPSGVACACNYSSEDLKTGSSRLRGGPDSKKKADGF